jgi:DNA-binding response OmpR family regulator
MRQATKLKRLGAQSHESTQADVTGDETVLVVEDDASVRRAIRRGLESYGYTVLSASNGTEALSLSSRIPIPPDLLLTDVVMPDMSGKSLVDTLRHEGRMPKLLMMSGYSDEALETRCTPSEGCPLIRKPFGPRELAARMREILDT